VGGGRRGARGGGEWFGPPSNIGARGGAPPQGGPGRPIITPWKILTFLMLCAFCNMAVVGFVVETSGESNTN